jgi:hypothetical protein
MAARGRLFVAREAFSGTSPDGVPFVVNVGQTIREGHPILKGREIYVEELARADFDTEPVVEQATAAPGEKRRTKR